MTVPNVMIECNNSGGAYKTFDAERNDIWALGVIFATILGGRMPWHKASEDDVNYIRHMRHPHYLRQVLPISREANFILQRIFHPCPEYAPSLDDIRLMVNAAKTFFMDDREISRSKRLQYIADKFVAAHRFVEAAMDAESDTSVDSVNSPERQQGLQSHSLAAMEEGRMQPEGTPAPKPFVFGMMLAPGGSPALSALTTPPSPAIVVDDAPPITPPQPRLTPLKDMAAPPNGTSSTLITSKDYDQKVHKHMRPHNPLRRISRSVRSLFRGPGRSE